MESASQLQTFSRNDIGLRLDQFGYSCFLNQLLFDAVFDYEVIISFESEESTRFSRFETSCKLLGLMKALETLPFNARSFSLQIHISRDACMWCQDLIDVYKKLAAVDSDTYLLIFGHIEDTPRLFVFLKSLKFYLKAGGTQTLKPSRRLPATFQISQLGVCPNFNANRFDRPLRPAR